MEEKKSRNVYYSCVLCLYLCLFCRLSENTDSYTVILSLHLCSIIRKRICLLNFTHNSNECEWESELSWMYCIVAFNSVKLVGRGKKIKIVWVRRTKKELRTFSGNHPNNNINYVMYAYYAHKRKMANNNQPMLERINNATTTMREIFKYSTRIYWFYFIVIKMVVRGLWFFIHCK